MNANNSNSNWHDAFIDRGLAEIVGNETPPDITDQILAAKAVLQASVSLPEPRHVPVSLTHHWVMFASAACALIALGTFAYMKPSDSLLTSRSEVRQSTNNLKDIEIAQSTRESGTVELPTFETIPVQTTINVPDGGTLLSSGLKPDWDKRSSESLDASGENPMMGITPHIIIQEGEEERPGIAVSDGITNLNTAGTPVAPTAPAPESLELSDLSGPHRQSSFGLDKTPSEAPTASVPMLAATPYVHREFRNTGDESGKLGRHRNETEKADTLVTESLGFHDTDSEQLASSRESRLAENQSSKPAAPAPGTTTPSPYYYEGEQLADLYTRRSKSLSTNLGEPIEGTTFEFKAGFAARGEQLRGRGQRFRIDAAPGSDEAKSYDYHMRQWRKNADASGDQYTPIEENDFITAKGGDAVSTFSIDVDTASYANVRQFLEQSAQLPPPDAVRIEELVNYFPYDYEQPTGDTPFAADMEVAACPWNPEHRLARIAIKGKEMDRKARPQSNLVFLIDVSGSMDEPNKLPLLVEGMKAFTRELGENDRVAIVVYASSEGLALPSTRGDQQQTILTALDNLRAGGSTAGGAGIELAYKTATENFVKGGTNRVILCTDGDFNVGVTSTGDLTRLAEQKAKDTKVFLTVLGFGRGNLNDAMMESISSKGNGNYHYVDNLTEARKVLVEEMTGTLVTIAKDVKIQVEFNPAQVAGYRLIGYENRMLATQDFNDDKKDAGEIGAGHTVTALYEIVPAGKEVGTPSVDPLKYQPSQPDEESSIRYKKTLVGEAASNELLTLKLRYKLPDADTSTKVEYPIIDKGGSFNDASDDFQFAAAVASFGMMLRHSQYKGQTSYDAILEIAQSALGKDPHGYRAEFLDLVRAAKSIASEQ
jgi:secreted protein with Ig-like and vWFA domain